jgi:hypothetical protein
MLTGDVSPQSLLGQPVDIFGRPGAFSDTLDEDDTVGLLDTIRY